MINVCAEIFTPRIAGYITTNKTMIHLTSPDIGTDYITQGVARDVPNHPGYP